jgi:hypothetical protein
MKNIIDSIIPQSQLGINACESFEKLGVGGEGNIDRMEKDKDKDKKDKKHKRASSMGIFKRNENNNEGGDSHHLSSRPITPIKNVRRIKNQGNNDNNSNCNSPNSNGRMSLRIGKSHSRNNSSTNSALLITTNKSGLSPNHSPSKGRSKPLETIESNETSDQYKIIHGDSSESGPVEISIRSSEQDPSPHQTSIPPVSDFLLQAKLCHLMERYREIDQNFDLSVLTDVSRQDMELFVDRRAKSPPRPSSAGENKISPPLDNLSPPMENVMQTMSSVPASSTLNLAPAHKPIVKSIISCASDLVLSGFYYETNQNENSEIHDTTQDKAPGDRTEVAVFASDVLRQFIVVYQGSAENQTKPIRNRFGKFKNKASKNFGDGNSLTVFPAFEQGYNLSGIEERVFQKLDALAELHPFFDVIMTGHSYGAMLALLGSMRYACSRPAMMVSCYAFGCPKVGALDFRHCVHSLPNLKIMRLEYGFDPWVHAPENPTWTHAGHTISILPQQFNKDRKIGSEKPTKEKDQNNTQHEYLIRAYKFGNDRPDSAVNRKFIGKKGNRQEKQIDHDLSSYLNAIGAALKESSSWPRGFVGEEGSGVQGLNSENRLVC